jgi:hypothetical protein
LRGGGFGTGFEARFVSRILIGIGGQLGTDPLGFALGIFA